MIELASFGSFVGLVSRPEVNVTDFCAHDNDRPKEMEARMRIEDIQTVADGTGQDDQMVFRVYFLANAETALKMTIETGAQQEKKPIAVKINSKDNRPKSIGDLEILPNSKQTLYPGEIFWVPIRSV